MEKVLSDAEMQVMQIIWKNGGKMQSAALMDALESADVDWARSTVSTFISRLCEKGVLCSEKQGRSYLYTALVSGEVYGAKQARELVEKVFSGNAKNLVAALVEEGSLSQQDIAELSRYWNENEAGVKTGK